MFLMYDINFIDPNGGGGEYISRVEKSPQDKLKDQLLYEVHGEFVNLVSKNGNASIKVSKNELLQFLYKQDSIKYHKEVTKYITSSEWWSLEWRFKYFVYGIVQFKNVIKQISDGFAKIIDAIEGFSSVIASAYSDTIGQIQTGEPRIDSAIKVIEIALYIPTLMKEINSFFGRDNNELTSLNVKTTALKEYLKSKENINVIITLISDMFDDIEKLPWYKKYFNITNNILRVTLRDMKYYANEAYKNAERKYLQEKEKQQAQMYESIFSGGY
ncbi:hypothetical protein VBM87_01180 [Mycoplasma sp. 744]|uniref:hypothetical protein n=1 Tax=Mycoplasma sp. 744 TaxID=3108531 RepID=UPI002B1E0DE0|nr:hypothetical protein [Mycoplasma sp. 744]MEA4115394.1 hypothetical protein [Mycoplasma sp. 744]